MLTREYYGLKKTKGEVGVEIELEGYNVGMARPMGWNAERDGSLRGESVEFVMKTPVALKDVHKYVTSVKVALDAVDARPEDSGRAGVHVHVNMQEYTLTQVMNVICAYIIFEDLLTDFCGEHRVGNFFCLRVRDADRLLFALRDRVRRKYMLNIDNNDNRYAAINIESLPKFGSLEFRAMRSTADADEITQWAGMLISIRDWAVEFKDPRDIILAFSQQGAENVFEDVFAQYQDLLQYDEELVYEGMRNAQYIAFGTDEWEFDPELLLREVPLDAMHGFHGRDAIEHLLDDPSRIRRDIGFALHLYHELQEFLEDRAQVDPKEDGEAEDPFEEILRRARIIIDELDDELDDDEDHDEEDL